MLLYYFSVYVNLSKISIFCCLLNNHRGGVLESGCKSTANISFHQIFLRVFCKKVAFLSYIWYKSSKTGIFSPFLTFTIINEANERVNEELRKKKESSLVAYTRLTGEKRAKYGLKAYTFIYTLYTLLYIKWRVKSQEINYKCQGYRLKTTMQKTMDSKAKDCTFRSAKAERS